MMMAIVIVVVLIVAIMITRVMVEIMCQHDIQQLPH